MIKSQNYDLLNKKLKVRKRWDQNIEIKIDSKWKLWAESENWDTNS